MLRFGVISLILLAVLLISGEAYCQQEIQYQQIRSITGTVIELDAEGSVINVKTDNGKMVFFLQAESDLYRFTHHIASIEIARGDQVAIQYVYSSGKNNIIKLVDNSPSIL